MSRQIRRVADVNPPTPELRLLNHTDEVTFMPLEAVWPDGRWKYEHTKSADTAGYTAFRRGDVLMPKITPTFEAGRVFVTDDLPTETGLATTEVHVLRPTSVDARYLAYFLRSYPVLAEGAESLQGVGNLRRVSTEWVESLRLPVSGAADQLRIAEYLDREIATIDTLIDKQRLLAVRLRERRMAFRGKIAMGGLSGTENTKNSGLPWAERIPSHWAVVPLLSVSTFGTGHTPNKQNPALWTDAHHPWISLRDVSNMVDAEVVTDTHTRISDEGIAASAARLLPKGTVVLSRDATIGRTAIMGTDMAISQHFGAWTPGPTLLSEYIHLLFSSAMQPHFDAISDGATLRTIGMGDIKAIQIPLPPIEEQETIIREAIKETAKMDALIAKAERFIELAQERRAALITAAVTGQISVD